MTTGGGLEFGVYPLGVAGTPEGLAVGPPDNHEQSAPPWQVSAPA